MFVFQLVSQLYQASYRLSPDCWPLLLPFLFVVKGTSCSRPPPHWLGAVLVYSASIFFGFWGKVLEMQNNARRVLARGGANLILSADDAGCACSPILNLRPWHVRLFPTSPCVAEPSSASLVALALFPNPAGRFPASRGCRLVSDRPSPASR